MQKVINISNDNRILKAKAHNINIESENFMKTLTSITKSDCKILF